LLSSVPYTESAYIEMVPPRLSAGPRIAPKMSSAPGRPGKPIPGNPGSGGKPGIPMSIDPPGPKVPVPLETIVTV